MTLHEDWRRIVRRFWSFRLAIISSILSAAEVAVQFWQPAFIPAGLFAVIAGLISLGAGLARIVAQPKAYKDD